MATTMSFERVEKELQELMTVMKTVSEFKISSSLCESIKQVADAVEEGNLAKATNIGGATLAMGRNILGAFLKRSVVNFTRDEEERVARFNWMLEKLRDREKYDSDIIADLQASMDGLTKAVQEETDGTFVSRVTAYNACCCQAFEKANREQKRRDRVRDVLAKETARHELLTARAYRANGLRSLVS